MRHIIFDTETTGLDVKSGHRLIEVGAVEVIDYRLTGRTFHEYFNPERVIDRSATKVHGIKLSDVKGKPKFKDIAQSWIDFVGDSPMVAHNASFDAGFINAELTRAGFDTYNQDRFIDTLDIAREIHTGRLTLDSLCSKYNIDRSHRTKHGALLDAQLLAQVFIEMSIERQGWLFDENDTRVAGEVAKASVVAFKARETLLTRDVVDGHREYIGRVVGDNSIWNKYWVEKLSDKV